MDEKMDEKIVEKIVDFSTKVKVTFDTLRSIAFEVSNGNSFSETIEDLNISQGEATKYVFDESGFKETLN